MQDDLKSRVDDLEYKTRSLPYTILFAVFGMIAAALIQYKINAHFNEKIRQLNGLPAAEVSSHAK